MHHGRAQAVIGGSARETQVRFFTETEAREWATTGKKAADGPNPAALPMQADPVRMQKPPPPDTQPAAAPGNPLADPWNTTPTTAAPDPVPAPAADPSDATPAATSPAASVDDDQAVGLREAHERHLPDITIAALRYARADKSPSGSCQGDAQGGQWQTGGARNGQGAERGSDQHRTEAAGHEQAAQLGQPSQQRQSERRGDAVEGGQQAGGRQEMAVCSRRQDQGDGCHAQREAPGHRGEQQAVAVPVPRKAGAVRGAAAGPAGIRGTGGCGARIGAGVVRGTSPTCAWAIVPQSSGSVAGGRPHGRFVGGPRGRHDGAAHHTKGLHSRDQAPAAPLE
ncbi:hypothetical protein [Streptomyces sp. NRRL WC-3725]|uniref:hypothetical protein n=1 Tax=Streptomyces sp. NRRL WC-3725 TaxID=1463933 RepID=UPI0004CA03C8|nr:hypothetical protein [Streptomyces sp. NRRL WC-3725]